MWGFVESSSCRRVALLRHFGDAPPAGARGAVLRRVRPVDRPGRAGRGAAAGSCPALDGGGDLDAAIFSVVDQAEPTVGRTRAVEILRGGRSKVVVKYSYNGLPGYGSFSHLPNDEVLSRVDELLAAGRLRSTGGHYPKLELA